jgi:uncharacterized membrane protein
MDDFLLSLFGCAVVLGIIAVPIVIVVVIFRRFGRLEAEIAALRGQLAQLGAGARPTAQPAVQPAAAVAPAAAGEPAAPAAEAARPPSVETVVTVPTPAFFETRAVAEPPAGAAAPAAEAPPDRPPSVETVVSMPLPAQFETRAAGAPAAAAPAAAAPARAPAPAPARPAKPGRSLEETLWTRLPVWIGAIALALAAAYLVKLSIDAGYFGPAMRVTLGVVLGVALLGAGEWLRKSSDYVAKGLSAAGIAALFVSFFAATSLYGLIGPPAGFGLMALTTATAVALSLRQGYIVAVVGLLGGFLTPALAGTAASSSPVLFVYLLLLEIGLLAVSRRRDWGSLPLLALVGGLLWVLARVGGEPTAGDSLWIGLFLLFTTGLFLLGLSALRQLGGAAAGVVAERPYLQAFRWLAVGGSLVAMVTLLATRDYGTQEWVFFGLIAGGAFVLARLDERYHAFAWVAAGLITLLLGAWAGQLRTSPERAGDFVATHLVFGILIAAGAYAAHFGSRFPGRFASLSAAAGVAYLLMQYFHSAQLGTAHLSWGAISLGLAVVYTLAALPAARRRPADAAAEAPLAALAVGATTLLSLAVPLELERQWLTVAWALEVWALMWLARRLSVGALRVCAALLSVLVAGRLLLNPEVISYPIGRAPVFNWLLYGYGIPLLAFVAAARLERQSGRETRLGEAFQWLAQAFAYALVSLEIRHFFYRDAGNLGLLAPGATDTHLVEWGTYASFWLLLVFLEVWAGDRLAGQGRPSRPLLWGTRFAYLGVTAVTLLFTALVLNPLWNAEYVGATPVFNWLLWIYGLPALLRFLLALRFERRGELWLARTGYLAALLEVFLLITFEVRQAFQGSRLDSGVPSTAESYAYSFAWIALAFVMAVIGVRADRKGLRYGSALIMLVAVFKVFLVDTSNLEGIFRVLSLFGLGVALFLLAYLYRRFVFPPEAADEAAAKDSGAP